MYVYMLELFYERFIHRLPCDRIIDPDVGSGVSIDNVFAGLLLGVYVTLACISRGDNMSLMGVP